MKGLAAVALAASILAALGGSAVAAPPACPSTSGHPCEGLIYLNGALVRTILPPAATPQEGSDNFYMVAGVGGVAVVGPGRPGLPRRALEGVRGHGPNAGLTSEAAILAAAGVTITRRPDLDFLCPIQP